MSNMLGDVMISQKLFSALKNLTLAAAPIEEDGGSESQREIFSDAFIEACGVLTEISGEKWILS